MARPYRLFGLAALLVVVMAAPVLVRGKTVEELRTELQSKKQHLESIEKRINEFKNNLQLKKKEARTLEGQISIIEDNIQELELSIDKTRVEIDKTGTEIEEVSAEINTREQEMAHQKDKLAEYIRQLYSVEQQSSVTVFLKYQTLSDMVTEAATFKELQNRGQETLNRIQVLHKELTEKRRDLKDFKEMLEALQRQQEQQQKTLVVQQESKQRILQLTHAQEREFTALLQQSQQAHKQAEAEISQLDRLIREELEKQGFGRLPSVGTFNWPIEPAFGVSCEFHCGGYPYEYLIGPHSGIDIPTYVGTPIKAPADGYVGRLHEAAGAGYSYILLLHGENISTVYGHVSGFGNIREGQLITRGTVIGYTGGAPGSRGAGLSSGPHLHFEVRKNNVPVNPRSYL